MVHAFIRSKDMVHSKLKSESSRKKILDQLSTFPGLKPNPLLELDFEGNILLANNAALSALQNTGANLDARKLLPKDIAPILENLKNKKRELFVRKVEFGNTCFKETIHFNSQSNSVLVAQKADQTQ